MDLEDAVIDAEQLLEELQWVHDEAPYDFLEGDGGCYLNTCRTLARGLRDALVEWQRDEEELYVPPQKERGVWIEMVDYKPRAGRLVLVQCKNRYIALAVKDKNGVFHQNGSKGKYVLNEVERWANLPLY